MGLGHGGGWEGMRVRAPPPPTVPAPSPGQFRLRTPANPETGSSNTRLFSHFEKFPPPASIPVFCLKLRLDPLFSTLSTLTIACMAPKKPTPTAPRQRIKRAASIKVGLSDEVLAKLVTLSELLGVPAGTLASLAIGQYVAQQERSLGFLQSVSDQMGDAFREEIGKLTGEQLKLPK